MDQGTSWPGITRRGLLVGMAAVGLSACLPRGMGSGSTFHGYADPSDSLPSGLFALGVACGDPTPDGFVLWTRLAPSPLDDLGGMPDRSVLVRWQVASDAGFSTTSRFL